MDHDELCQWANTPTHRDRAGSCPRCDLIARVRADERERIVAELEGPAQESEAMYAHAEAVAARLVEVICEQDDLIQIVGVDATNHRAAAADMRRERDAARARTVEAEQKVIDAHREVALARAEVAGLRQALAVEQSRTTFARIAVREVLADLRAKVEGLRDEAIWARRGTVAENGLDTVPSAWHNGRTSLADAVLALIEEVSNA